MRDAPLQAAAEVEPDSTDGASGPAAPEGAPADGPQGPASEASTSQPAPDAPPELAEGEVEREVAALLFASPEPLSVSKLAALLGGVPASGIQRALEALGRRLAASGLPWELREIGGGWQLYTTSDMAETVARLQKVRKDEKVSPAGLETLAIIAYRQPATKAEIEAIRGVQVGPILRTLVERGLVKVAGRSDDPGHPLLYATTRKFLDAFGLASLDDLPRDGELLRD